jgi:hypothetical protein
MKISLIISIFLITILICSGCLNKSNSIDFKSYTYNNSYPSVIIDAPKQAYFEEYIEFDATNSYDSDGEIITYYWIFGDGETAEGKKVKHTYRFENDLNINYPLIYTYSLLIVDNYGAKIVRSNEIMIFPKKYQLFLQSGSVELEKPSLSEELVKTSYGKTNKNPSNELYYKLIEPINVSECTWNITLCLKKPMLTRLSKIKIILYDSNDIEISQAEKKLGIFRWWNKKTFELNGKIKTNTEFQSIKIFFYGISFRNKISILYGSESPSNIYFNFKN